jgi:F-type H+-transporting ATPase subunit b
METTVVAVAFIIFMALIFKPAKRFLLSMLDTYAAEAIQKLEEAQQIHKEAQAIYSDIKKQSEQAKTDSKEILQKAKKEAEAIINEGKKELERITNKKAELTLSRIAQQEKQIIEDLKSEAINIALEKVQVALLNELDSEAQMSLIENGIRQVKKLVH